METRPKFRYGQIEQALVDALRIEPGDIGAFRARLRHLRGLGLPNVTRPGSGRTVDYTWQQAFEMLLALELENIGKAPRIAKLVAESIGRMTGTTRAGIANEYIVVEPSLAAKYEILTGEEQFRRWLTSSAPRGFSVLNLSACIRALDAALIKTT